MIARGFKPVAWVAAIGSAALCCYMLSLQVASERAELSALERRIVSTQQDIRALQTELGTRGRLSQLENWNSEVLALSAPVAGQFLESNMSLARFDVRQRTLADGQEVRMASAAPAPAPPAAQAPVRMASAQTPAAPAAPAAAAPAARSAAPSAPLLRRASLATPPASPAEPSRPKAVQARSSLIEAGTLDDLQDRARAERRAGGGN